MHRLDRIEAALDQLLKKHQAKPFYTVEEFGALVSRAPFSVREWARLGRIHAEKRRSGRGKYQEWVISHEELLRYQRHGLLSPAPCRAPVPSPRTAFTPSARSDSYKPRAKETTS